MTGDPRLPGRLPGRLAGRLAGRLLRRGAVDVLRTGQASLRPVTALAAAAVPTGPLRLHAPGDDPALLAAFPASLATTPSEAAAVLEVRDARCLARTATDTDEPVLVGALRDLRGRRLRGPAALLDHPTRPAAASDRRDGALDRLRIDGTVHVLDLRGRSAVNYFHLLVDALANIWLHQLAAREHPDLDVVTTLLLPRATTAWQQEVLALAGLRWRTEGEQDGEDGAATDATIPVIAPQDAVSIEAERFVLPVRSFGSRRVPDWIVDALRAVGGPVPAAPADEPRPGSRLYISRADADRRRVADEDTLITRLEARGFESVTLGGMSVAAQRRRFAAADVIVAPHGAALTNLAWSRPGTRLVELLPLDRPNLAYLRIARQAGVAHEGLICRPHVVREGAAPGTAGADGHGDITVDVELLCRIVDASD
jgi:hypothetical protein